MTFGAPSASAAPAGQAGEAGPQRELAALRAENAYLLALVAQAGLDAEHQAHDAARGKLRHRGELAAERAKAVGARGDAADAMSELAAERASGAALQARHDLLATGQARLAAILESAADFAILTSDLDGLVTSWSKGAANVLGWPEGEALGRPAHMIFTPEDRTQGAPEAEMATALREGRAEDERWHLRRDGTRFWASGLMMPLRDADGEGEPRGFLKIMRDQTDKKRAEDRAELLAGELHHRVKNTLALVQAIVAQGLRGAATPAEAREAIEARLLALGRAHDLLVRGGPVGADLRAVVDEAVRPHDDGAPGRFEIAGPSVMLSAQAATALALVLHELATNATKHGALSAPEGRVAVAWTLSGGAEEERLRFLWRERSGPRVEPPRRRGFGSRLIEGGLAGAAGQVVWLAYEPAGASCEIEVPTASLRGAPTAEAGP